MYLEKLNGYSKEIQQIIEGLIKIYDEDCDNIVLYGSAAQNKLTYRKVNGRIEFFSDMEFYVVPKNIVNENNKEFNKVLMRKSYEFLKQCHNLKVIPFVDVCSVPKSFFYEAELRISTYELKNNGIVLKGENLLSLLPEVDVSSYNSNVQNIEIIKGLKILLLESYNWFQNNIDHSKENEEKFYYFLSSSLLNILRTLLPLIGEFKLSTEERVRLLDDKIIRERTSLYFSEESLNHFKSILKDKKNCDYSYSIDKLFTITIDGYKSILCMLLDCTEAEIIAKIEVKKNNIFYGSTEKVNLLGKLTRFFILALNCMEHSIGEEDLLDEEIDNLIISFNDLMESGSQDLTELGSLDKMSFIIEKYKKLEKIRWRIIGSKD